MATANFTVAPDNTSDATFRAWITAFFNAVATILTYVAQTGDLDPSTPATPNATSQKRGFRCYRFDDDHQDAHPIYIRFDVGSGGGNANQPGIWVRVGNSLNGSGTLDVAVGGALMAEAFWTPSKAGSAVAALSYVSGDSGRLTMALFHSWLTVSEMPWALNIERTPDGDGNPLDHAVAVDVLSTQSRECWTLTKDGRSKNTKINSNSFIPVPYDDSDTTATLGLKIACFPPLRIAQARVYNAVTGILFYFNQDYDGVDAVTVSVYGTNRTYITTQRGNAIIQGSSTALRVMARND